MFASTIAGPLVGKVGFEPTKTLSPDLQSGAARHLCCFPNLAGDVGVEPTLTRLELAVLPEHLSPISLKQPNHAV